MVSPSAGQHWRRASTGGPCDTSHHTNACMLCASPSNLLRNLVDLVGIEPTTSSMRWKRAPSCATGPHTNPSEGAKQFSPMHPA
jgi:hypothetical protein